MLTSVKPKWSEPTTVWLGDWISFWTTFSKRTVSLKCLGSHCLLDIFHFMHNGIVAPVMYPPTDIPVTRLPHITSQFQTCLTMYPSAFRPRLQRHTRSSGSVCSAVREGKLQLPLRQREGMSFIKICLLFTLCSLVLSSQPYISFEYLKLKFSHS